MPLYEYQCDACGHRFEVIQKFSDAPIDVCPTCGGSVTKLISSPAFQFKGTGWYVTDYARKDQSANGGADRKKSGGADAGAEAGSKTDTSSKSDAASASEKSSPASSNSSSSGSSSSTTTASSSKDS